MGIKAVILTNAAGGINRNYSQGCLVVIRDHVNLQGVNPLVGPNDERFGLRFPDMTQAYDREFQRFVTEEGKNLGQTIHNGVYLAVQGPSYETPAEIYSFRTIGADLVGMSTVPEVIVARHSAIRVLGISCVTNMAAGTTDAPLNQEEVLEIAARIKPQFISLLRAVIPRISEAIA
jgi:purine-nucleoside phosphorylase